MWSFRYSNQVKGQNPTKILTKKHLVYRVNHFYLFLVYLVNQRNNSSNHNYLITKLLSHCIKLGASTGGTTNKKPQLVDLQLVEVLFIHKTPFGVLYRVPKFRNFLYIRKS